VGEPPLVNHPELTGLVDAWISDATGLRSAELRSCGADDFAYYGELFPSTMVFYGIGDALPDSPGLHHPRFLPSDDDVAGVARCQLAAGCGQGYLNDDGNPSALSRAGTTGRPAVACLGSVTPPGEQASLTRSAPAQT
jgi:amidohydrolase